MFIAIVALVWLSVSFAFVLALAVSAKRPIPQAETNSQSFNDLEPVAA